MQGAISLRSIVRVPYFIYITPSPSAPGKIPERFDTGLHYIVNSAGFAATRHPGGQLK